MASLRRRSLPPAIWPAALALLFLVTSLPVANSAPTTGTTFEGGIDVSHPGDPTGAVSQYKVVTTTNGGTHNGEASGFRIHDRSGTLIDHDTLDTFWGKTSTVDPRTVFDPYGKRFITAAFMGPDTAREIGIAASTSDNPTSEANFFKQIYTFDSSGACQPDYTTLGFNKDWVVVAFKILQNPGGPTCASGGGVRILAFEKAKLYNSQSLGYFSWDISSVGLCGGGCDYPLMPATTFSQTLDKVYLINEYNRDAGQLQLRSLSGPISAPVLSPPTTITAPGSPTPTWGNTPLAPQQGTTADLITDGPKIDSLIYRNGDLWAAHTVGLSDGGVSRSAVQWWEISESGAVKQFGRVDDLSGKHRIYGSIAVNSNDDVLIGYTLTGPSNYPSSAYAWRQGNTAKSQEGGIDVVYYAGNTAYSARDAGNDRSRWGDYTATVVDPTGVQRNMWTMQLASNNDRWTVRWAQVQFYGGLFDPTFNGVRGNQYWVQTTVATSSAAVELVEVSVNGGAWRPLSWQGWGWGASYQINQGSIVQLRAHSVDGSMVLSDCYQWIPPANTDATKVSCVVTFDATFTPVPGNDYWVEVRVTANQPIASVWARVNCGATWTQLPATTWGSYAKSFYVAPGSKVDFKAVSTSGATDYSGAYIWPNATPTTPC